MYADGTALLNKATNYTDDQTNYLATSNNINSELNTITNWLVVPMLSLNAANT